MSSSIATSPPEASTGDAKTTAFDVFSLARTAEYVLRGRDPTVAELASSDPVATLDTSDAVKAVLRAALRSDPLKRTRSIEQFCADLRGALETSALPSPLVQSPAAPVVTPATFSKVPVAFAQRPANGGSSHTAVTSLGANRPLVPVAPSTPTEDPVVAAVYKYTFNVTIFFAAIIIGTQSCGR